MTRPGYQPADSGVQPGPPPRPREFTVTRRYLDEVRGCALRCAVDLHRNTDGWPLATADVLRTAATFESWLSGGEPPDPAGR